MVKEKNLFSIIMPAFNASKTISSAINSVLNQTIQDWELIIVNDNSKDNTLDIIKKFSLDSKKIKLINLVFNVGAATARNIAIKKSKGRFIAFLDSDDYWFPKKLEKQLDIFMKGLGYPIVFSNFIMKKNNSDNKSKEFIFEEEVNFKSIIKTNSIATSTAVYDTNIISKQYLPNLKQRHDWALWLKILKKNKKYYAFCVQEPLVAIIKNKESLSSNRLRSFYFNFKVLRLYSDSSFLFSLWRVCFNVIRVFFRRVKAGFFSF